MDWNTKLLDYQTRLARIKPLLKKNKIANAGDMVAILEAAIKPKDKVCLEGNNQKQADFLASSLCKVNPQKVHNLHMIQSAISLPKHLDLFEKGVAECVDFAFAGKQAAR